MNIMRWSVWLALVSSMPLPATAGAAGTAPPPDPCAVVSQADAEKLSGKKLQDAGHGAGTCSYGPAHGGLPKVEVYIGAPAERFLAIEQSLNRTFRPLAGVGDEAFISDASGLLFVKKSSVLTAVRFVTLADEKEYRKRFEGLAGMIAGRL